MKWSSNKVLLIVFAVLLGGFVVSRMFRAPALESNLPNILVMVDTARVTEVQVLHADTGASVSLVRDGNAWQVNEGQKSAGTETGVVRNALGSIGVVKPDRIITRKKQKWNDFHVDSTGTHVKVLGGDNLLADFWLGRAPSGMVCMRLEGKEDVYEVQQSLDNYFSKKFNDWRDKSFLHLNSDSIFRIAFEYPADSSFVVEKKQSGWMVGMSAADSTRVVTYLNRFRSKNLYAFADDFSPPVNAQYTVSFGKNGHPAETVRAWQIDDDKWIATSSVQEGVYFSVNRIQLINDLFAGKKAFLTESK